MPQYDFRCKQCKERFTLFYKTYSAYDNATPECPHCGHTELSRLITSVAINKPGRDYTAMSSNEMLSVLESGDSRQVGEMFDQVGGGDPALGAQYHETTKKLLDGQGLDKVESDLKKSQKANNSTEKG